MHVRASVRLALLFALVGWPGAAHAQPPVAELGEIRFHSSFWINLHITLYAEALRDRPPAPGVPRLEAAPQAPLPGDLSSAERMAWNNAVAYYKEHFTRRDLRGGESMSAIQMALGNADDTLEETPAIDGDHRSHLLVAAPVYRRYWWPQHDRAIRAWIADVSGKLREVGQKPAQRQARLFESEWLAVPVRAEITFFGRAYSSLRREVTLTTMAAAAPNYAGWAGAEMMFHEISHAMTERLEERIRREAAALGKQEPRDLWHACLFYITGEVWRSELAVRGIQYDPYLYATGLFDRAWKSLRAPIETHLKPYVDGRVNAQDAFRGLIQAIPD